MKRLKICRGILTAALLSAYLLSLCGCGKKDVNENTADTVAVRDDRHETDEPASDAGETDYEAYMDSVESDTPVRIEIEGDNADALNGKIASISPADTSYVAASTTDGSLFLLNPTIYRYDLGESEMKSHKITDNSGIGELLRAGMHVAYGRNRLIYFDTRETYEDVGEDWVPSDSFALPELSLAVENLNMTGLSDDQSLLAVMNKGKFAAYVDTSGHVQAVYMDDAADGTAVSEEPVTLSETVIILGDDEKADIVVRKGVYRFILTEEQELLYLKGADTYTSYSGEVEKTLLNCVDVTGEIGGRVADVYNLHNYDDGCYVVDEDNNIYFVEVMPGGEPEAEQLLCFEDGTIADIQGFAGTNEKMLIKTDDGSYYYNAYDGLRKLDALDGRYKSVVLLMDETILALGTDGNLYLVEN